MSRVCTRVRSIIVFPTLMTWFWSSTTGNVEATSKKDVYAQVDPELKAYAKSTLGSSESGPVFEPDLPPQPSSRSGHSYSKKTPNDGVKQKDQDYANVKYGLPENEYLDQISTKSRRNVINSGARYNCAVAEADLQECFISGSWWDKAKLCESYKNAFWNCVEQNKKTLTILGYGEAGNSDSLNAEILDKADELVEKDRLSLAATNQ